MKCIPFTDIGEITIAVADFRKLIWLKYSYPHCALVQWKVGVTSLLPLDTMLENIMNYFQDVKEVNFSYSKKWIYELNHSPILCWYGKPQLSMDHIRWFFIFNHCINVYLVTIICGYTDNFCFYLAKITCLLFCMEELIFSSKTKKHIHPIHVVSNFLNLIFLFWSISLV